jgi:hypothetical protein
LAIELAPTRDPLSYGMVIWKLALMLLVCRCSLDLGSYHISNRSSSMTRLETK